MKRKRRKETKHKPCAHRVP